MDIITRRLIKFINIGDRIDFKYDKELFTGDVRRITKEGNIDVSVGTSKKNIYTIDPGIVHFKPEQLDALQADLVAQSLIAEEEKAKEEAEKAKLKAEKAKLKAEKAKLEQQKLKQQAEAAQQEAERQRFTEEQVAEARRAVEEAARKADIEHEEALQIERNRRLTNLTQQIIYLINEADFYTKKSDINEDNINEMNILINDINLFLKSIHLDLANDIKDEIHTLNTSLIELETHSQRLKNKLAESSKLFNLFTRNIFC